MLSSQEQRQRIADELARISRLRAAEQRVVHAPAVSAAAGDEPEPIAVIGLAGYFPGCMSVKAFWQAIDDDRCLLEPTPESRLALWSQAQAEGAEFLKSGIPGGGFIPDIRSFDPAFFGVLPGQAHSLDPRQRLLLMSVQHCLEDAGYAPGALRRQPVGVFVGIEEDEYFQCLLDRGIEPAGEEGLCASRVANRISWFYDFRGPSEVVNTMCSGGALALHRAVCSLRLRESTLAVVGAANLLLRPEPFLALAQTGQLSPELAVRSFGREAKGFLRSDGVASVLLKRLSQAEADGDPIYAVIRHSAVNYNGKGGISLSGPDIAAHAEVIERCWRQAGVDPREIRYIEAQGMGHPVADLAEWQALNRALTARAGEWGVALAPGSCRVGTLKPMIGHMHSASALGALFRIIRSLQTGTIHRILGFSELNPELECPGQSCAPALHTEPWPASEQPRLAGLHSYGAGGNNAHLLVQEYREKASSKPRRPRLPTHPFALKDCWYDHLPHRSPASRNGSVGSAPPNGHSEAIVRELLSRYLEVAPERVELDAAFTEQGFSSKMVAELASQLRRRYSIPLEPARFFEFKTPRQLVRALEECSWVSAPVESRNPVPVERDNSGGKAAAAESPPFTPIAIIGLAGTYPGSPDVDAFWDNLRAGRDCISEIPSDHWPVAEHFDPNPEAAARRGKSYGKWGGFISGLNEFDPLFFKISPLEAESMNPKERWALQTVWHVLEDAGYTPESLSGERVGVFFGVTRAGWDPYPGTFSSVANRVSYFCDFHGPSVSIDTMCSSSLVAIHEACQHLQTSACDVAVAGGVNLYLHPSHFVVLAHGRFLSPDGKCRAFGAGANGMTPGEGVGAVLLKPLDRAVRDGDRIYGVIRGSACNHGGTANGYTVPNPAAHKELVLRALQLAGVNPRRISFVEAHGTGTALGDPIEIRGLTEAYRQFTSDRAFCRVGALKSNMGHLEAAAGIAGLTKVVMQMKHRELVASLHASELNPDIDFGATPFVVQQSLESWRPEDAEGRALPRLAAVSSFGAGGSNAHLIVEEFPGGETTVPDQGPQLIVLSARNEDRLREVARRLHEFVQNQPGLSLRNLAYTLQAGRQAMEERLALVVDSLAQLEETLRSIQTDNRLPEGLCRGHAATRRRAGEQSAPAREFGSPVGPALSRQDLETFGKVWGNGGEVDWARLYTGEKPRRLGLPLYPFARVVIPPPNLTLDPGPAREVATAHPLAQRNTSTLNAQRFSSTFVGREFFLAHHVVAGRKMLPAAACLEMARAAVEQSLPPRSSASIPGNGAVPVVRLSQVVWTRPLCVADQPVEIQVAMTGNPPGPVRFEISGAAEEATPVYSQGAVELGSSVCPEPIQIEAVQAETSVRYDAEQCYGWFSALGIDYGPGYRGLEWLRVGPNQVLARLRLPDSVADTADQYGLHPSLVDAAFQGTIGFALRDAGVKPAERTVSSNGNGKAELTGLKPALPYGIERVEIFGACTSSMWAVIRRRTPQAQTGALETFDLDLCDEQGSVRVSIRGFAARLLPSPSSKPEQPSLMLRVPVWEPKAAGTSAGAPPAFERHVVLYCGLETPALEQLKADPSCGNISWIQVGLKGKNLAKDFHDAVLKTFGTIRGILDAKPLGHSLIQVLTGSSGHALAHSGVVGMLRTAQLEFPRLRGQFIQLEPSLSVGQLAALVRENAALSEDVWIRYLAGKREVASWRDYTPVDQACPWKAGGVYLITGGLGGLGRIFANEIALRAPQATLILIGRSELDADGDGFLRALRDRGAKADYRRVDLRQRDAVKACIQNILGEFGALHGILHAAGVLRDQYLLRKSTKEVETVLGPKVTGTVNLDEATREIALDFFVLFSSGAALGNPGQGDYAAANAFLDGFARYREELSRAGQRQGRTIAIAWPYWKEGGMRMDAAAQKSMAENTGLVAMETCTGLEAFYRCMASSQAHILVLNGEAGRPQAVLDSHPDWQAAEPAVRQPESPVSARKSASARPANEAELNAKTIGYLQHLISETLKIQPGEVQPDKDLYGYGLDSIIALEVNNRLEKDFSQLSKTLFFEYATIRELAGYFLQAHREKVEQMFPGQPEEDLRPVAQTASPASWGGASPPTPSARTATVREVADEDALATQSSFSERLDELILSGGLEVIHPVPRSSRRAARLERWPNWHSLFQSFAVFETVQPEFSFSRMAAGGSDSLSDAGRYLRGQVDLRRLLFRKEDFRRVSRILDVGCGRGADVIELALSHHGLEAQGVTVDPAEGAFAGGVVRRKGLGDRVRIVVGDNATHDYEKEYDLAFSIQVMHFIPELEAKRELFRRVAGALRADGVLLMAEFVALLGKPMRDPVLNTTVHTAREWAEVLGENGLVLQEVADLSAGIANFLQDPDLERHIAGLDKARQVELRKYNRQVTGLENRWICYCAMRVLKEARAVPVEERIRQNLERFNQRIPLRQACAELAESPAATLYRDVIEHFQDCVAAAGHSLPHLFDQGT